MAKALTVTDTDLDVAARTLWGECRGEELQGQFAVAWVIRNRLSYPKAWWSRATPRALTANTVAAVCLCPWQFSCWNGNSPELPYMTALARDNSMYVHLREVARQVFAGEIATDPSHGSTMYEVVGTGAKWAQGRKIAAIIGRHEFFILGPNEH